MVIYIAEGGKPLEGYMIISSQRYLDDQTVELKRQEKDYTVTLSPVFVVDGQEYQTVIDGHHSLAAAKQDGAQPIYSIATSQECDRVGLLETSVDDYLTLSYMDSDWYDIETNKLAF